MTVSINILNYNTYEKSCVCIESCLKQTGINFQILLIDNASTDDSFSRLKKKYDGQIQFLQTGTNYGYAGGNNRGIKYCMKNDISYALMLNSDTELVGNTLLSDLIKIAITYDKCAVVAPTIYEVREQGYIKYTNNYRYNNYLSKIGTLPQTRIISSNLRTVNEAHGSALLVNCSKFLQVGGFPEHYFMYCEESTFAKKILWNKYEIIWYDSDKDYVLHHHDYTNQRPSWSVILEGRNRLLEFVENCKWYNFSWGLLFQLFVIKIIILSFKSNTHKLYLKGMMIGVKQSLKKRKRSVKAVLTGKT